MASFVVLALVVSMCPINVHAATPADVAQVVALLQSAPNAKKTKFNGTEFSFLYQGKQYGFWYSRDAKLLSVWVRTRGTNGQKILLGTFSDQGLDGTVDFGINGKDGTDEVKQYFSVEEDRPGKSKGEEFRPHWQSQYDQAISTALRVLKK